MKQFILIFVLGLGLITLSACSLSRLSDYRASSALPAASDTASTSTVLVDGDYKVDTAASRVAWQAERVVTPIHTGFVSLKSGSLQVTGGALSGASFVLDMASITNDQNIAALVKHLKSADFFDVANYPEARLVVNSVQPGAQAGEYSLSGDLTVKDITAPVNFTAQVVSGSDGLEARANFIIDRTKWGIKYQSGQFFQDLGDKIIKDEIKFAIFIKASR